MFRRTSPQQSLLESQWLLPREKRERLYGSWAQAFRSEILPLIDEEPFRCFFEENNGQPNKSIRLLVGVHLLKERFDLTDEQVIENLEFNLAWQHALAVEPSNAHLCQKTLHNFRALVIKEKLGDALFVDTTREIAKAAGISFACQRHDSTHVVSNMALLTRLGILVETISVFLKEMRREQPEGFEGLPAKYAERYLDREGYFADAKKEQARRRLPIAAQDLFRLVERFDRDQVVSSLPSFSLMRRVLDEQCRIVEKPAEALSVAETPCEPPATSLSAPEEASAQGTPAAAAPAPAVEGGEPGRTADVAQPPVAAEQGASEAGDGRTAQGSANAAAAGAPAAPTCGTDVVMREPKEISSASLQSPHDPDATYGHKGKGYEVQLTETCGDDNPFELITSVAINGAHESDQHELLPALDRLAEAKMSPETMFADTGFGSGENIVGAAERGVTLMAPVQDPKKGETRDGRWENAVEPATSPLPDSPAEEPAAPAVAPGTAEGKLGLEDCRFSADFNALHSCPAGKTPSEQSKVRDRVEARFEPSSCAGCPLADRCPGRQLKDGGRRFGYRPAEAATAHRQRQQGTAEFKEAYKIRSGIESTNSQIKGPQGADELRVRGKSRVELAMQLKALALNAFRFVRWAIDESAAAGSAAAALAPATA